MKILILSSLFPPDPGSQAPYVKELAQRLSTEDTSLLIYGHLPEVVTGVTIEAVDKRRPLLVRLFAYTRALMKKAQEADVIIVNNAPSTELPAIIVSFIHTRKMILCESDPLAKAAAQSGLYKNIHTLLKRRCVKTVTLPEEAFYQKPEVLPFTAVHSDTVQARETWWEAHVKELKRL